jgi:hypothetical protein
MIAAPLYCKTLQLPTLTFLLSDAFFMAVLMGTTSVIGLGPAPYTLQTNFSPELPAIISTVHFWER